MVRRHGDWVLAEERPRQGGNAFVFRAERGSQKAAIKVLKERYWNGSRLARFADEIEAMQRCADIPGVLPILEVQFPRSPSRDLPPWFAMPLAQPMGDALAGAALPQVVEAIHAIAGTLARTHERGISHRDIKPDNLFKLDNNWYVGDFGLADFEGKSAQTAKGEKIGPIYFIAPEMLNHSHTADGKAADVYSLAKTLWVLATGQRYPLPGQHDLTVDAYTIGTFNQTPGATQLDRLLVACTAINPTKRLTMAKMNAELGAWINPPKKQGTPIILDLSKIAPELETRRLHFQTRQDERKARAERNAIEGLRLRERFRSLYNEVLAALVDHFHVAGNIDNFHYGFEVTASIPEEGENASARLVLKLGISFDDDGTANIYASYNADLLNSRRAEATTLWKDESRFLPGGSEEEHQVARLETEIRTRLQQAVMAVIELSRTKRQQ